MDFPWLHLADYEKAFAMLDQLDLNLLLSSSWRNISCKLISMQISSFHFGSLEFHFQFGFFFFLKQFFGLLSHF